MTHFSPQPSLYRREWVNDLPTKYCVEWQRLGLVRPPVKSDGTVVRCKLYTSSMSLLTNINFLY